jgi:tetratricopeptide (TPR) repeat protein
VRRPAAIAIGLILIAGYGYQAYRGWVGGWIYDRGHLYRNITNYERAAPRLESGAVGFNRQAALAMAGGARLSIWEEELYVRGAVGANSEQLILAARDFLECRCVSPASREAALGLADVYNAFEWVARERRAWEPQPPSVDGWDRVGREGRVAIGLGRQAIEYAPNWNRVHDQLALTLMNYGLEEEAREALRDSVRALPLYQGHAYRLYRGEAIPDWVEEEFALTSYEMLGKLPMVARGGHLLDLGKQFRRANLIERSVEVLEQVVAMDADPLRVAEANFQLGVSLVQNGQAERAQQYYEVALEHPRFRAPALRGLATVAENREDYQGAFDYLRQLRWAEPKAMEHCFEFARMARIVGNDDAALESLRWARQQNPTAVPVYLVLAEFYLDTDDTGAAMRVADELEQLLDPSAPELLRLRRKINQ